MTGFHPLDDDEWFSVRPGSDYLIKGGGDFHLIYAVIVRLHRGLQESSEKIITQTIFVFFSLHLPLNRSSSSSILEAFKISQGHPIHPAVHLITTPTVALSTFSRLFFILLKNIYTVYFLFFFPFCCSTSGSRRYQRLVVSTRRRSRGEGDEVRKSCERGASRHGGDGVEVFPYVNRSRDAPIFNLRGRFSSLFLFSFYLFRFPPFSYFPSLSLSLSLSIFCLHSIRFASSLREEREKRRMK